jgi:hypothetical protein
VPQCPLSPYLAFMTQFIALSLSLIVEIPIVLLLLRPASNLDLIWLTILACGATMLTHPLAWESNLILIPYLSFLFRTILIEGFVILIESALFSLVLRLQWKLCLITSFIANIVSFFTGLIFFQFIGKI